VREISKLDGPNSFSTLQIGATLATIPLVAIMETPAALWQVDLFFCAARALAAHIPTGMSAYLLFWYKSTNTDSALRAQAALTSQLAEFTCCSGTKVRILTECAARRPPSHPNWAKAKKAGLDHSGDAITDHYLWKQLVLSGVMFQVDSHTTRDRERERAREREREREEMLQVDSHTSSAILLHTYYFVLWSRSTHILLLVYSCPHTATCVPSYVHMCVLGGIY
jgi:hypothetical protein